MMTSTVTPVVDGDDKKKCVYEYLPLVLAQMFCIPLYCRYREELC
jgi:hypothetical protein